ncbi:MAG: site-2 protease family protein [Clostridiales bacterium]|jgi:Zn-dependent protease|nr:site-2 protease family protein [Clostridiales bacterium]
MLINIFREGGDAQTIFITLVAYICAILTAFTLHEFAHGFVAKLNGDDTAKLMGRLTLNPIKHLDPIGAICLLVIGFGWAKPVPINSNNFKNFRKGLLTTSLAGVTTNLILALVFTGLYHLLGLVPTSSISSEVVWIIYKLLLYFFVYSVMCNLVLMVFNLLPVFPLDGFRVLEALGGGKVRFIDKYIDFCRRSGGLVTVLMILAINYLGVLPAVVSFFLKLLHVA